MRALALRTLGSLALLALVATARADDAADAAFTAKAARVEIVLGEMREKSAELEKLRDRAAKEGDAIKLSCIDEKLKRLRTSLKSAQTIQKGYSVGRNDPGYAGRQLDRLNILHLLVLSVTDEAYQCAGTSPTAESLNSVTVDGQKQGDVPVPSPVPPPYLERPPLASPY
jgi:hypothetical protein